MLHFSTLVLFIVAFFRVNRAQVFYRPCFTNLLADETNASRICLRPQTTIDPEKFNVGYRRKPPNNVDFLFQRKWIELVQWSAMTHDDRSSTVSSMPIMIILPNDLPGNRSHLFNFQFINRYAKLLGEGAKFRTKFL